MSDEMNDVEKTEDSSAEIAPVTTIPPAAAGKDDPALKMLGGVGVVFVALGGLILAAIPLGSPRQGATRSARMQTEQRIAEIRQAMADSEAAVAAEQKSLKASRPDHGDRTGQ